MVAAAAVTGRPEEDAAARLLLLFFCCGGLFVNVIAVLFRQDVVLDSVIYYDNLLFSSKNIAKKLIAIFC